MRYGFFDDDQKEYVITQPDTPLPWINYLGCQNYFGILSNTAGGYSFYKDARLRRLTRYRYNNAPLDMGGRYLYLRENGSNNTPDFWSPTWAPVKRDLDSYECRHGLGYSIIYSSYRDIKTQVSYFVPLNEDLEIWDVRITNHRGQPIELSLFSAVEFCLWDANDDATNFQRNYSIGEVEVEWNGSGGTLAIHNDDWPGGKVPGGVIYHKTEYRERRDHFAFFACSHTLAGFDTQRDDFLGAYRGWDNPRAVYEGKAENSLAFGWQPIGSHHIRLNLQPGEDTRIIFTLGYCENSREEKFNPPATQWIEKKKARAAIARVIDPIHVDRAFEELRAYWDQLLKRFQVQSPDLHTNRMVNIWNAYQCMVTFNMSRSASYFESGVGRGMGFRDSNQDLLGFVHMIPERARERLLDLTATQLSDGGAYHQYQPLTKRGNMDVGSGFNDDPLWLVLAVTAYVKETGDWSILQEDIPYDHLPGTNSPLFEHLERSIRFTLNHIGPHGLPLIGHADWNDCLNLNCFSDTPGQSFQTLSGQDGKVAESVFIAGLFVLAAREMIELMDAWLEGNGSLPEAVHLTRDELTAAIETMSLSVWQSGWDGQWFRRAYDHFGHPIGSQENQEGQIFIEPQGMCIMAGLGVEDGRAQIALDSVGKRLATPHGIILQQPAYSHYYLNLGEISSYPPGYKENAGIFCHTNPWIMIAETCIGRGDKAFEYYQRINPSARENISEIHRCEPYVYAQMIAGADAPTHGEAKNSWLSGTAAWNYVAITQYILGIRPTYDGLCISPVIPQDWQTFQVERNYRGACYQILVVRKGPGNTVNLFLDGQPLEGNVVPYAGQGAEVQILVDIS